MADGLKGIVPNIITWWKSRHESSMNSVGITYKQATFAGYATQDLDNAKAAIVIEAMTAFISDKKLFSTASSMDVVSKSDTGSTTDRDKYLAYQLLMQIYLLFYQ
jgi:hypothetical protein